MASDSSHPPKAGLWPRLWRAAWFKRGFYEVLGLLLWRRSGPEMLNCGYAELEGTTSETPEGAESLHYGYRLYGQLVRDVPLAGRDVVEFGCGLGEGARYLARRFGPHSYLATDASRTIILRNQLRRTPGVRFAAATAGRLPLPDASVDVVLAVEALHPLPDKQAALDEIARVLRPGGVALLADFFYARETSPQAAAGFRSLIARSPLGLVREEDWTANAVAALAADSPRRLAQIDQLPRYLRGMALAFAGTTRSPLYQQLQNHQAHYLFFYLRR